ncbi:MAG: transcription antiterminator [Sporolactobacillus sp.]
MDSRCAQILVQLRDSGIPLTITQLSLNLHVSHRTISYDLNKIDKFLISLKLPILSRTKKGISTLFGPRDLAKLNHELISIDNYQYILSPNERKQYILSELIASHKYITIQQLADELSVSRSTIILDLKAIKEQLESYNISIESKKHEGIRIIGNEKSIRRILFTIVSSHFHQETIMQDIQNKVLSHKELGLGKKFLNFFENIDIGFIERCIQTAEQDLNVLFSDIAYSGIVLHIAMAIKRIQSGKDIIISTNEMKTLSKTKEFSVASSIASLLEKHFKISIPIDEIAYITIHFLGASSTQSGNKNKNLEYEILTQSIVGLMTQFIQVDLSGDQILFQGLINHIGPVIYRLQHNLQLQNPLLMEIKENYQDLLIKTQAALAPLERYSGSELKIDETAYFVLHFAAALERQKPSKKKKVTNVLIICSTGIGSAQILCTRIQMIFNVNIVECLGVHRAEEFLKRHQIDLIISTIPVPKLNVESIVVNPLLKDKDIHRLQNVIEPKKLQDDKDKYQKLMHIIAGNCKIIHSAKLKMELQELFGPFQEKVVKGLMLKEVLTKKVIQTNVPVNDWEDAINKCGKLLINSGAATEKYVEAMIQSVKTIGPYIVIAPGIAMPHARPEDGALKTGFSLITLAQPVSFGNKENDPVSIVVCICSSDHTSHIKALSELVNLLGDESKVQQIERADRPETIVDIVQHKVGTKGEERSEC